MTKPQLKMIAPDNMTGTELNQLTDHNEAIRRARRFELPIIRGLQAWEQYAQVHKQTYDAPVMEDGTIGDYWAAWGFALRCLLQGQTGRLNCGHLDRYILELLKYHGATDQDLANYV